MAYDNEKPKAKAMEESFKALLPSCAHESEVMFAGMKVSDIRLRPDSAELLTSVIELNQTPLKLKPQIMLLVSPGKGRDHSLYRTV